MGSIAGISIVIPNFNGEKLLPQILPTVFDAAANTGLAFEILVVDDCSSDGSLGMLREIFPSVKVLSNEKNSGFSITSNKGIRAARYDWVLLLNSDVKLEPGFFLPLLKCTARKNIFGVSPRIIGWDDDIIQDAAKYPFFHGVKIKTSGNYMLADEDALKQGLYSIYISGAAAFINRPAFTAVGGFNELFSPFYVEDYELCLRAWRLGYECYYAHDAVCRHRVSTTIVSGNKKNFVRKIYNRNKMYLHAIHLSTGKRWLWFMQLILESLVQLATFKLYHTRALILFLKSYGKVIDSRADLRAKGGVTGLASIRKIAGKITLSVSGKEVIRF